MTCLEIKNTHFIDLLNPELKDMDQSAVKYVIRKEIKNVNEALSALYKGTYNGIDYIHIYIIVYT